ncbi:hypothetical protein E3N88_15882 [Mikania micrantha]|uniref:Uncharacterized protein n=1 Tax=Mikania micrantha TaxID=192012 RepID=A0A5N6NX98_9ASTR|nr:hypothetical protein E3N88_15882 [Mikania micrantha]
MYDLSGEFAAVLADQQYLRRQVADLQEELAYMDRPRMLEALAEANDAQAGANKAMMQALAAQFIEEPELD